MNFAKNRHISSHSQETPNNILDLLLNKTSTAIFIFGLQIRKISSAYSMYKPPQFYEFSPPNLKISLIVLLNNRFIFQV